MDETQAREYYIKIKTLREQLDKQTQRIHGVDDKISELLDMKQAISKLDEITPGDELLVPLTNGVFIKAQAVQNDSVILHVGADTTVQKTPGQTQKLLDEQHSQLISHQEKIKKKQQETQQQLQQLEAQVTEIIGQE